SPWPILRSVPAWPSRSMNGPHFGRESRACVAAEDSAAATAGDALSAGCAAAAQTGAAAAASSSAPLASFPAAGPPREPINHLSPLPGRPGIFSKGGIGGRGPQPTGGLCAPAGSLRGAVLGLLRGLCRRKAPTASLR